MKSPLRRAGGGGERDARQQRGRVCSRVVRYCADICCFLVRRESSYGLKIVVIKVLVNSGNGVNATNADNTSAKTEITMAMLDRSLGNRSSKNL